MMRTSAERMKQHKQDVAIYALLVAIALTLIVAGAVWLWHSTSHMGWVVVIAGVALYALLARAGFPKYQEAPPPGKLLFRRRGQHTEPDNTYYFDQIARGPAEVRERTAELVHEHFPDEDLVWWPRAANANQMEAFLRDLKRNPQLQLIEVWEQEGLHGYYSWRFDYLTNVSLADCKSQ